MTKHLFHRREPATFPPSAQWQGLTIAQAIRRLLTERTELRPTTATNWKSISRKFQRMIPQPIRKLTDADFLKYTRDRVHDGAKNSSINQELTVAQLAVRRSGRNDLRFHMPPRQQGHTGIAITPEQQAALLTAAKANPDMHLAILLGLLGLRHSEILQLCRADFDHANKTLTIKRSKTAAGIRRIPLPDPVHNALLGRLVEIPQSPHAHIFPGATDPNRPRQGLERAWNKVRRETGLTHVRFHDLRHTAITTLCEAGVPDWTIRAYVGHVDDEMMKLYSHPRQTAMQKAADALAIQATPTAPRSQSAIIAAAVEQGTLSQTDADDWEAKLKRAADCRNPKGENS
jgi:integrase